jgi:glycosyltransferase involved in cell wall biosynthesis
MTILSPMGKFAAVTIVAHNYLPQARILARSFLENHPEDSFCVVVVDRPLEASQIVEPGVEIYTVLDINLGDEGHAHMAAIYDVTEFATALKPFVLRHLLREYDCVFYIDPDIKIFASLDPLREMTEEFGWSLTPHVTTPIVRTGAQPTEQEIKGAGIYNLGFVGVTRRAIPMLDWWSERLRRDAIIDVPNQLFTDQRWIDMAVSLFPAYVERTVSYNVAYWNLDQRRVWKDGDTYMVNEDCLRFFHFSGYDPDVPHWISKYQTGVPRVLLSSNRVVAELCHDYGQELLSIRDEVLRSGEYGWRNILPGLPWTRAMRRYLRNEILDAEKSGRDLPPTPYGAGGSARFVSWLREANRADSTGLPRHVAAVYWDRPDLQAHFAEVQRGDLSRFQAWIAERGPVECRSIRFFGADTDCEKRNELSVTSASLEQFGIDVVGYLNAEVGIGEAGRLACEAMRTAGLPITAINFGLTLSRQGLNYAHDSSLRYRTLFLAANADQIPVLAQRLQPGLLEKRYVISQWFWELEQLPTWYEAAYEHVDEVWAPTKFIFDAMKDHLPGDVELRHMQLPLLPPTVDLSLQREDLGLGEEFVFLFTFDFFSVLKRKNAIGLVEAYCSAFSPGEGARLIIKSINGHARLRELERLKWAARNREDVMFLDDYMTPARVARLMELSDCYVSLHRSEGLGLTMAEAMHLGKPVIATAYGGNLDFMTGENSLLVPWSYTEVGEGADSYDPTALWAEPDLQAAANQMRLLYEDRTMGRIIGTRARDDIRSRFSKEVCGERMNQRLMEIWGEGAR